MLRIGIKGIVSDIVKSNLGILLKGNEIALFLSYSEEDIPIGHKFKYIIIGQELVGMPLFLKYVTQQFGKEFNSIPKGWKTIAVLEAEDKIPEWLMEKMKTIDSWDEESSISNYLL